MTPTPWPRQLPRTEPEWERFVNTLQTLENRFQPLAPTILTYSASLTPDLSLGSWFIVTATDTNAFTVNVPANALSGASFTLTIKNSSGGSLGTITWGGAYRLATWTSPANTKSRSITFDYDGTTFTETSRTPADVPL